MNHGKRGFSLLELSIVIALIGLIAGVILVSQGFVRRNELRTILVDANGYAVAVQQFQLKYNGYPGDLPMATEIWGTVGGGTAQCTNPLTDVSNGNSTCNGNGNGYIEQVNCEHYRVWQHLMAAGMIQGKFTGVSGLGGCVPNSQPGTNVPVGSVKNSGWSITSYGEYDASAPSTMFFDGNYNNAMFFGGVLANNYNLAPSITAEAAREADQKADDASPQTGAIRGLKPGSVINPSCTVNPGGGKWTYNEVNQDPTCALVFTSDYLNKTGR